MRRAFVLPLTLLFLAATTALAVAAGPPSATTGSASSIRSTSAVLHGTVNPNGNSTMYSFQWGTTTAYGSTSTARSAGNGTEPLSVQESVSGLAPGTTYHYRVVATNSAGTADGADRTFTTAGQASPEATTGPAQAVATTSALITGTVNPRGTATTYLFQYGTTPSYGVETFNSTVPAGNSPVGVSRTLSGLAPATVFHYRLVARRGSSVSYGADQQFMTYPAVRPAPGVRARTTPRRDRHAPFAFTTTGHIIHPAWMPSTYACSGNVRVRWWLGRRKLKTTVVPVSPNCTFVAQSEFARRPPGAPNPVQLTGFVTYLGSGYLAPAHTPHKRLVTLG